MQHALGNDEKEVCKKEKEVTHRELRKMNTESKKGMVGLKTNHVQGYNMWKN